MARKPPSYRVRPGRVRHTPAPQPGPILEEDLNVDAELKRLRRRFFVRIALTFLLVSTLSTLIPPLLHIPAGGMMAISMASAFGVAIPYWRGMERLGKQYKEVGRERLEARRLNDARRVLEYFHTVGNMGFDLDGEAHYLLAQAYAGLGQVEKAQEMAIWLEKHRPRSPFLDKTKRVAASAKPFFPSSAESTLTGASSST